MALTANNDDIKTQRLMPYQRDILDRIPGGRDEWLFATGRPNATYYQFCTLLIRRMLPGHRVMIGTPFDKPLSGSEPIPAFINHNRWIAMCECGGQETVDIQHPYFYCWACHNYPHGGYSRHIIFPDKRTREAITLALLVRPLAINRNWHYLDSVEDLEGQNLRHGLPIRKR